MDVPLEVVGVRLYRYVDRGERLIACEPMRFAGGSEDVNTVLRRAAISGRVEIEGQIGNYFADLLDEHHDLVTTVALDADSYRALKTRWMRCKVERPSHPEDTP